VVFQEVVLSPGSRWELRPEEGLGVG